MGFRESAYATVWSVEDKGGFVSVRLSTSRKNKDTDQYEQDFSGYCMFIGTAKAKALKLRERDRIKLVGVDVTSMFDKERQKEYINFKVFDFEPLDGQGGGKSATNQKPRQQPNTPPVSNDVEGDVDEDEVPF